MNVIVFKIIGVLRNSLRITKRNSNVRSKGLNRVSTSRKSVRKKNNVWWVV